MPTQRPVRFASFFLIVALITTGVAGDELRNVKVGDAMPAFSMPTIEGGQVDLKDFESKVLVIVYLSAEQRSSESAAKTADQIVTDLNRPDLKLLLVSADTVKAGYFREFRDASRLHCPLGLDFERTVYGDLGLIVLPTTVVIDGKGKLAHVISSHKSDYEHVLRAYVEHALGMIDDEKLAKRLETRTFERDRPTDRITRRRATAQLLRKNGLTHDAENELRIALDIDPANADVLLDLVALYVDDDRIVDAEETVNRVLEQHPMNRRAKLLHGIVLYHQDRLDEAEAVLKQVLLLNPDPIYTHYYLGLIAEKKGDAAGAAVHYRESLVRALKGRPI